MTNTIKETTNFGEVIGLLKTKNLKSGISKKTNEEYINGSIVIEYNNKFGVNNLKIDVMQMKYRKKDNEKKENGLYKIFETIKDSYKCIDNDGRENAEKLKVYVRVTENNYVNKEGDLKEQTGLLAAPNFSKNIFSPIKRVEKNTEDKSVISFAGMITNIKEMESKEILIEIVGAAYDGSAIVNKLIIPKELAGNFLSIYGTGCVTTLHYTPVNSVEVKEIKSEGMFGEAPSYTIENSIRKNIVLGGENINYESDMTQEKVKEMLNIRRLGLNQMLEEYQNSKATNNIDIFGQSNDENPFEVDDIF